jgi:group I intron endonuclease
MIVYLITNLINGKQYVGKTTRSLKVRWARHQYEAIRGRKQALYYAIRKYGAVCFSIEVLEEADLKTEQDMNLCEILYIKFLNTKAPNGYNLTDGGEGTIGREVSLETRNKLSKALTGKRASQETKDKMRKISLECGARPPSRKGIAPWNKGRNADTR